MPNERLWRLLTSSTGSYSDLPGCKSFLLDRMLDFIIVVLFSRPPFFFLSGLYDYEPLSAIKRTSWSSPCPLGFCSSFNDTFLLMLDSCFWKRVYPMGFRNPGCCFCPSFVVNDWAVVLNTSCDCCTFMIMFSRDRLSMITWACRRLLNGESLMSGSFISLVGSL